MYRVVALIDQRVIGRNKYPMGKPNRGIICVGESYARNAAWRWPDETFLRVKSNWVHVIEMGFHEFIWFCGK